jgi:cell shape-determining protein MreD
MNAIFSRSGSGIGSLICFLVLIAIAGHAKERAWSPLWLALVLVLSLCYLWRFFIQPFRAGLREKGHDKKKGT